MALLGRPDPSTMSTEAPANLESLAARIIAIRDSL